MPVFFVLFIALLAVFPYMLLFTLLLLPRLLPSARRIPRKRYMLADAGISFAVVLTLTLISGRNPLNFTVEYFGDLLMKLVMLVPMLGFGLLGALIVNIPSLFTAAYGDDTTFRFKPRLTALAAVAVMVFYVSATVIHVATIEVEIPEQYAQYVDAAELEEKKQMFIKYGGSDWKFPTSIKVVGAGEDWVTVEAYYFPFGMLGAGRDGLYNS